MKSFVKSFELSDKSSNLVLYITECKDFTIHKNRFLNLFLIIIQSKTLSFLFFFNANLMLLYKRKVLNDYLIDKSATINNKNISTAV